MQMIDVLKKLAELDAANPNRPEYKVDNGQNITTVISESADVAECGMMGAAMGSIDRPSTPATINMTAGNAEELGDLIKDIMSLAGHQKTDSETLSTTPSIGLASQDGMDMKSMMDKLNDIETVETIDSMPNDPMPTEPFDAEQHAHHENPPGADRRGNANNPRAYDTMESIKNSLMADYRKFLDESQDISEGRPWDELNKREFKRRELDWELRHEKPDTDYYSPRPAAVKADYNLVNADTGKLLSKDGVPSVFSSERHAQSVAAKLKFGNWKPVPVKNQGTAEGHNDTFEPKSHAYKTTMKHADRPTVQQRMAAHDIKPGISGYRDRIDMLQDLERTGRLKGVAEDSRDEDEQEFIARQKRLATPDDKPKDPKRQAFLDRIPGYKDAMTLAQKTTRELDRILAAYPDEVEAFKQGGGLDYDLEAALWDYYFRRGDIRNYDADASEYIAQWLSDELGLKENLTGQATRELDRILAAYPDEVEAFKQSGALDYDLEAALWDYYFRRGDIRNYDADANAYIAQQLSDELGLEENLTGQAARQTDAHTMESILKLAGIKK